MKQSTIDLIKSVLSIDETILPDDAQILLKQLQTAREGRKPRPRLAEVSGRPSSHCAKVRQGRATHAHSNYLSYSPLRSKRG